MVKLESENDIISKNLNELKPCLISVYAVSNVLNSIIITRAASTGKEELKLFADMIIEDDIRFK
jgi:hypothetical protein